MKDLCANAVSENTQSVLSPYFLFSHDELKEKSDCLFCLAFDRPLYQLQMLIFFFILFFRHKLGRQTAQDGLTVKKKKVCFLLSHRRHTIHYRIFYIFVSTLLHCVSAVELYKLSTHYRLEAFKRRGNSFLFVYFWIRLLLNRQYYADYKL